jgi:hypothetical protein
MSRMPRMKTDMLMLRRLIALCFALFLAAVMGVAARAQRVASAGAGHAYAGNGRGGVVRGFGRARYARGVIRGAALWPYYYSDYDYADEADFGPPPPERVLQPDPPVPLAKPAESIVVELRGDHWVRLTSYGPSQIGGQAANSPSDSRASVGGGTQSPHAAAAPSTTSAAFDLTPPPPALPPAVLVFRDGHQEEASKYTIINKTIYIKSNYWSSGSWTRKIPIAELDLPATLQANQARGAKFALPSSPGEIMMRP